MTWSTIYENSSAYSICHKTQCRGGLIENPSQARLGTLTKTPLAQNPMTRLQLSGKKPSPMVRTMAGKPLPCDISIDWTSRNWNSNKTTRRFSSITGPPTTSSLQDPLACLLSDTQSAKSHLGHIKDPEQVHISFLSSHAIPVAAKHNNSK